MDILRITHNAGFFSCSTVALQGISNYLKEYGFLPRIDRSKQYEWYKSGNEDLTPHFFAPETQPDVLPWEYDISTDTTRELQFSDYKQINFENAGRFVGGYFQPSDEVIEKKTILIGKYLHPKGLFIDALCAVFYRGNDKNRETQIASYEDFISKAREVKEQNPSIRFLLQPDETEFLEAFLAEFPDAIYFDETPHIRKCDSAVFLELPKEQRAEFAQWFFAAVLIIADCDQLITHSGNCGLWATLYRGHAEDVHQYLNGEWL